MNRLSVPYLKDQKLAPVQILICRSKLHLLIGFSERRAYIYSWLNICVTYERNRICKRTWNLNHNHLTRLISGCDRNGWATQQAPTAYRTSFTNIISIDRSILSWKWRKLTVKLYDFGIICRCLSLQLEELYCSLKSIDSDWQIYNYTLTISVIIYNQNFVKMAVFHKLGTYTFRSCGLIYSSPRL